jgi:hypothetical protein
LATQKQSSKQSISHIINMNSNKTNMITSINDGACQIEAGDYRGAIVSLSMTLKSSKASMELEQVEQATEYSFDLDLLMTQEGPVDQKERSTTDTDHHMAYSRPIHIPERLAHESGFDAHVVFSAVAIFNLALAHHLGGMEDTPSSTNLLKKAAKLYQLGVNIQGQRSNCIIFFLATLNNLGDVHKRLGKTLKSEQYFKQLLSILMFLTGSGEQVSSTDLELFFKSTFFLVSPTHGNAAAAA